MVINGKPLIEHAVAEEAARYTGGFLDFNMANHWGLLGALAGAGADAKPALARAVAEGYCETAGFLSDLGTEGPVCDDATKKTAEERNAKLLGRAYRDAVRAGRLAPIERAVELGAKLDYKEDEPPYDTLPIEDAVNSGSAEMVAMLLSMGAKYELKDSEATQGLLRGAAATCNQDMLKHLLKNKVAVTTALNQAVAGANPKKCVPMLLKAGADINAQDENGETALFHLMSAGIQKIREQAGYQTEIPLDPSEDYLNARTALDGEIVKVAMMLLKKKANPNLGPAEGITPLYFATLHGLTKTAKAIKSKHGKLDKKKLEADEQARANEVLNRAASAGDAAALNTAIEHGAKADGATLLLAAAGEHPDQVIPPMLQANIDINFKNDEGVTPLLQLMLSDNPSLARSYDNPKDMKLAVMMAMLNAGADPSIADSQGRTASKVAESAEWPEAVEVLKNFKSNEKKDGEGEKEAEGGEDSKGGDDSKGGGES